MTNDTKEVLFNKEHLAEIIRNLGRCISKDYKGKSLLMVNVLRGSFIFMADLTRAVDIPCHADFMSVSSYGAGARSSGVVKIIKDLDLLLVGYDLLVVKNILDSGVMLSYTLELLQLRGPKNIKIHTLFDKSERRTTQITADHVGMHAPDGFITGHGPDYNETYQDLPYVGILEPHVYGG